MRKTILKILKILVSFFSVLLVTIWLLFFKLPSNRAEEIVNKFEIYVRNNDKAGVEKLVYHENQFWKNIVFARFQSFQNEFKKFHEGIDVYKGYYQPGNWCEDGHSRIIARGRMKAKKDNKYRKYFEILLIKDNGEWKLSCFYFPDFIDY